MKRTKEEAFSQYSIETFYQEWVAGNDELLNSEHILITDSDMSSARISALFPPELSCQRLTIHNCVNLTFDKIEYIINKLTLSNLTNITISYDKGFSGDKIIPATVDNIAEQIRLLITNKLDIAGKTLFQRDFTLTCETDTILNLEQQEAIGYYSQFFNITVNNENMTQAKAIA